MTRKAYSKYSTRKTPQSQPIPGENQVLNNAGGYVWEIDDFGRLRRFLVLGSTGNAFITRDAKNRMEEQRRMYGRRMATYYVEEDEFTKQNAECVGSCLAADQKRTVDMIVEVSDKGLGITNTPALFALAMACSPDFVKSANDRRYAFSQLSKVARIGTHVFEFAGFLEQFRGWGTLAREYVGDWYNDMPAGKLAYQAVKYQQRDGWSHLDLLRLAHPKPQDNLHDTIYGWIAGKNGLEGDTIPSDLAIIEAFEQSKKAETAKEVVRLIEEYGLPREAIMTQWLNDRDVWDALLRSGKGMPLTAMIRNLGKMTSIGLLSGNLDDTTKFVVNRLGDTDHIHKSRVHPMAILLAMSTYEMGHGVRGSLSWEPVGRIVDALDQAFYSAFANVEPTGLNILLGIDHSGSMQAAVSGTLMHCSEAAVAMALVTANVEPNYEIMAYSSKQFHRGNKYMTGVPITPNMRLTDALRTFVNSMEWGGTDCGLPFTWAKERRGVTFDAILNYTDSETWAGNKHPYQELEDYRRQHGPTKTALIGMVANHATINKPNDPLCLEIVGFDSSAPQALEAFLRQA